MAQSTTRKNRLAGETSPYLLLHQHNPVDWHPWGAEALEKARAEEKPIFLSVGYATCHWCHVMERESFSDERTAELLNREFVNVKVDREERPELDEIYMTATQLLSSHGGWPNSVFLTPELKPFYAGTYFPPEDRHGMPGFRRLLTGLSEAWRERRADVELHADELAQAMRRYLEERGEPAAEPPGAEVAERSLELLERRFDGTWAGFGGAPKFPTPSNLYLLLEFAGTSPRAAEMLEATLDRMARGGIYDQLAGGFHRYATDREWKVPHFEKMLYDNAQLLEVYAREHERSGDVEAARIARETFAFLECELSAPEGGFWSAIDAESEGREGGYHAWTREQLGAVLGEEDAVFLAPIYGFEGPPFFEGEEYVLHLPEPLEEQARRRHQSRGELLAEIAPLRQKLLEARGTRPSPLVDDKVLTDWNGMAIAGLAEAGRLLGEPAMAERAERAAEFVLREMRPESGPLRHTYRGGEARIDAFLADYAFLIRGLLKLHRAKGEGRWLGSAMELADEMIERLGDGERGGFFVAAEEPDVLFRSKEIFDGALPSANAVAVLDLLELAEASGEARFREEAEKALKAFAGFVEEQGDAARMLALAARRYRQVVGGTKTAPAGAMERGAAVADLGAEARSVVMPELAWVEGGAEGFRRFRLEVRIREGWHVYAHEPGHEAAVATTLEAEGAELRALEYPSGLPTRLGDGGDEVAIYEGRFDIRGEVRAADVAEACLLLSYQPCELTRCLPPVTVSIPLE